MVSEIVIHTLLDEWQRRRDLLVHHPGDAAQFAREQIRVLDFLIRRYQNSSEAQRPAPGRSPVEFHVNHRAIVVHHHLWNEKVGGIKTAREAAIRLTAILQRMRSRVPADESETGDAAALDVFDPETPVVFDPAWCGISRRISRGHHVRDAILAKTLADHPFLPRSVALYLFKRIVKTGSDDLRAAELLVQTRNQTSLNFAAYAWRELIASGRMNRAWEVLDRFLGQTGPEDAALERVRESLAHDNALVRIAALNILGRIGLLEDIGLLSDLLALPVAGDEFPDERQTIMRTMQIIAETGH